jgi:hypothetical protein
VKFPTELKILGHRVRVKRVGRPLSTSSNLGEASPGYCQILITDALDDSVARATLLHESIHCLDVFLDAGLSEDQVCKISQGLFCLLSDNGNVFTEKK